MKLIHSIFARPVMASWLFGCLGLIVGLIAFNWFFHVPFRGTQAAWAMILSVIPVIPAIRHQMASENWQFSLTSLMYLAGFICILAALVRADQVFMRQRIDKRQLFERAMLAVIGDGQVSLSPESLIRIERPDFDDQDLRRIIALSQRMRTELGGAIAILDLSGTGITDAGVGLLCELDSLKFCFLNQTAVTNGSVDLIAEHLPRLQVVSFASTSVTDARLAELSRQRPRLNIEPKTYRSLLPSAE